MLRAFTGITMAFYFFKHVPSNPDVAPHSQSSSSSSSSPASTHVEWGNTINYYVLYSKGIINPPSPMTTMLNGVFTSTYLHKGITDQNPPAPIANMLNGVITPTYLHKRSTFATPFDTYVE